MQGFTYSGFRWRAEEPYPPVAVRAPNRRYAAAMLENLSGRVSEFSAVGQYVYGHWMTGAHAEVGESFRRISIVEMEHLERFGDLARQLGAQPRFWAGAGGRMAYWTAGYLTYPRTVTGLLEAAIRSERQAVRQYEQQMRWIRDENVLENLARVLRDERLHIEVFSALLDSYGRKG